MSWIRYEEFGSPNLAQWQNRRPVFQAAQSAKVASIISEVATGGMEAVLRQTRQFDAPELNHLFVTEDEIAAATIEDRHLDALKTSIDRVTEFHETQLSVMTEDWEELGFGFGWRTDASESDETGFEGQRLLPLASAGIYVPGGQASYPSSVIMNVVPAQVAGVQRIVVSTPPARDGMVSPYVLTACRELGITEILKAGGASAIASMALGFEGFERVDKVAGPGNTWVNEAKRQLWGTVGLDGYAGPSEVAVYVDEESDPRLAAIDLLAQLEHAPDNVGVLIATSREIADKVGTEVSWFLKTQPRVAIVRESLEKFGVCILVSGDKQAIEAINRLAPEHLSLHNSEAAAVAMEIVNCGCILIGPETGQSFGDFVSGPSHTLPTSGAARFDSPVNVQTFMKYQSISMFTKQDAQSLTPIVEAFAEMEGLPLHGECANARLNDRRE